MRVVVSLPSGPVSRDVLVYLAACAVWWSPCPCGCGRAVASGELRWWWLVGAVGEA